MKRPILLLAASIALTTACGADESSDYSGGADQDYYNGSPNGSPNGQAYYDNNSYDGLNADPNANPAAPDPISGENYEQFQENEFIATTEEATSTFSIDVDTASYTLMRRDIEAGRLPDPAGVRVEEYINFFDYDYPQPNEGDPFSINLEVAPSAFGEDLHMLRVGLKGQEIDREDMRPVNLVFLVDVSGSMGEEMPLVKHSLTTLTNNLRPGDQIGLVTYASNEGVALPPTDISDKQRILDAINGLASGGSTNGEGGIVAAYNEAEASKIEDGINRVILVTDGDFNVGLTGQGLRDFVESKRDLHIGLTVAGMGVGNYNDADLEAYARNTNGNYFYIDSTQEADRVFGTDVVSTLEVIAADVKVQIEFDSDAVLRYRLVGYENRLLANEDFEDDTKDAGEIGPGHTVTAIYEIELDQSVTPQSGFIAEVRLRHKEQFGTESLLQTQSIKPGQVIDTLEDASTDLRFAMAVVEYAEILRGSMHVDGEPDIDQIEALVGTPQQPSRLEFLELVGDARPLIEARD